MILGNNRWYGTNLALLDFIPSFDIVLRNIKDGWTSNCHVNVVPRHTSGLDN